MDNTPLTPEPIAVKSCDAPPIVSPADLPPDLYEYWQERAGIREFDGGLSRQEAETLALADVLCDAPAEVAVTNTRLTGPAKANDASGAAQANLFAYEGGPYR